MSEGHGNKGNFHPVRKVRHPSGRYMWIDVGLVPLVRALWAAGFETITCCQDLGESITELNPRKGAYWKGWALVELPAADATRLAELAAAGGRFPMHWAQDGAWEMSVPLVMLGARGVMMNLVQVHFPVSQLEDLTRVIQDAAHIARITGRDRQP